MPNFLIALFFVAHGVVHPILAYIPARDNEANIGGLWTKSWLLGDGRTSKQLIWLGSALTAILFALAGLSLLGWILPQDWWRTLTIAAAAASLLVLVIFWFTEFFIGVIIDVVLLALILLVNWNPLV
jgi:hypothetical protein